MVTDYNPRKSINLLPFLIDDRPRALVKSFAKYLHNHICRQVAAINDNYRFTVDLHKLL